MAATKSTYLELVNDVLLLLNEVEGAAISSLRGIQRTAAKAVNQSIRDIIAEELEWPFNISSYSQTLTPGTNEYSLPTGYRHVDMDSFFVRPAELLSNVTFASDITSWTDVSAGSGTAAHTVTGDGRLRLTGDGTNAGAAEQSVSTIVGKEYRIVFEFFGNDVTLNIGTASGGSQVTSHSVELENDGYGNWFEATFTATATTTYIGFANTNTTAVDIDNVYCRRDIPSTPLRQINYDVYRKGNDAKFPGLVRSDVRDNHPSSFSTPMYVYRMPNDKFGVTPMPDEALVVEYDYWTVPADLSANTDESVIPARYEHVLVARAMYYVLSLRSDPAFADRVEKDFNKGVKLMRTELINKNNDMVAV